MPASSKTKSRQRLKSPNKMNDVLEGIPLQNIITPNQVGQTDIISHGSVQPVTE